MTMMMMNDGDKRFIAMVVIVKIVNIMTIAMIVMITRMITRMIAVTVNCHQKLNWEIKTWKV